MDKGRNSVDIILNHRDDMSKSNVDMSKSTIHTYIYYNNIVYLKIYCYNTEIICPKAGPSSLLQNFIGMKLMKLVRFVETNIWQAREETKNT